MCIGDQKSVMAQRQPPMPQAQPSPVLNGISGAVRDPQFWRDVGGNASRAAQGLTSGVLGAPVDIASAAVRPFAQMAGKSMPPESVVGSSEWIGNKMGQDVNSVPWLVGSFGPTPDGVDAMRMASMMDKLGPAALAGAVLPDALGKYIKPGTSGRVQLKNPVQTSDGGRLSGFTDESQRVMYGYDKNGELFTVDADRVDPATLVGSRDQGRTSQHVTEGLPNAVAQANVMPFVGVVEPDGTVYKGYKSFVEPVSVDDLLGMRGNRLGKTDLEKLKAEIRADGGLREPVLLQVGKNSRTAIVGEGNHRVQAAKELGYTHIPARVMVQRETHGSMPTSPRDDLIPAPNEYFKSDAKPSEVFRSLGIHRPDAPPGVK